MQIPTWQILILNICHGVFSNYIRVSVQGVESLGGHFARLCQGFDFNEVKKVLLLFKKKKRNTFTPLIIFIVKSLQKIKIAQITYYEP